MPKRILFVGNSFVSRNGLPRLVCDLAAAAGHATEAASIVAGGASLRRHLNAGTVARALEESHWDHVVLQEQSTLPIKNPGRYHENVRALHVLIAAANARTVLYMTWARRSAPDSQQQITATVQAIGKEIGADVAPVGVAWHAVTKSHPEIGLYAADGSHPTAAGSCLAACLIYGVACRDPEIRTAAPTSLKMAPEVWEVLADAARRALE